MVLKRMVIYASDIQLITGKSLRTARKIMADIRLKYNKGKNQLISMGEFCHYTGLSLNEVQRYL
jgi:hypothetical protein